MKIFFKEVYYNGDNLNDLEVFKIVGYTGCPNDACKEIKKKADYICKLKGGYGAVRSMFSNFSLTIYAEKPF